MGIDRACFDNGEREIVRIEIGIGNSGGIQSKICKINVIRGLGRKENLHLILINDVKVSYTILLSSNTDWLCIVNVKIRLVDVSVCVNNEPECPHSI